MKVKNSIDLQVEHVGVGTYLKSDDGHCWLVDVYQVFVQRINIETIIHTEARVD